jgi:hypothetical protein
LQAGAFAAISENASETAELSRDLSDHSATPRLIAAQDRRAYRRASSNFGGTDRLVILTNADGAGTSRS